MKKFTSALALSAFLAIPGIALSGNISEYTFSLGDKKAEKFVALEGATVIPQNSTDWAPGTFIFADGVDYLNGHTGAGFPIGFDFHYGGQMHDSFVVSPVGSVMLGKGDIVYSPNTTPGISSGFSNDLPQNSFQIAFQPMMYGFKKGTISFQTSGEPGNRVCTVEYKNMILAEEGRMSSDCGKISFQIRLFEKDGKIQIAYIDEQIPATAGSVPMACGIRGYDTYDTMLLTGRGLDSTPVAHYHQGADITVPGTTLSWSSEDEDYGMKYNNVWNFLPCNVTEAPAAGPTDLNVVQKGTTVEVSCKRAEGAPYTLILYSTQPFTDNDMPADGISPLVKNVTGEYISTFGNATVIYNLDGKNPSAVIEDVPAESNIYVRALSANGYPAYNRMDIAEAQLVTTQPAPTNFRATKIDAEGITLTWTSPYPVIIGHTNTHTPFSMEVNEGIFGEPVSGDAKAGDDLTTAQIPYGANYAVGEILYREGSGGKVVYAGNARECTIPASEFTPNYATYLKIWNVKDGVVSAAGTQTVVVPAATMPYEPKLEEWAYGIDPPGWVNSSDNWGFTPRASENNITGDRWIYGGADGAGNLVSFTSPELPIDKESTLLFEWRMETANPSYRDPETNLWMPGGIGRGMFWDPANGEKPDGVGFWVKAGANGDENQLFFTDVWNGSGYKAENITIPAMTGDKGRISFNFATKRTGENETGVEDLPSYFYLRGIRVLSGIVGVETFVGMDGLAVTSGRGLITLSSDSDCVADVYAVSGIKTASVSVEAGVPVSVEVPAGIYVVNGTKVIVR